MAEKKEEGAKPETDMTKVVEGLNAGLKSVQDTQGAIAQSLQLMAQNLDGLPAALKTALGDGGSGKRQEEKGNEADLESLSRKDLVDVIVGKVASEIESKLGQVDERINNASETATRSGLVLLLRDAREKYPDFDEWESEIRAVAKEQPNTTPERAYLIARGENPEKAKELETKLDEKNKADEAAAGSSKEKFGGLQSGGGGESSADPDGKMTPVDAADKAFAEVFDGISETIYGGG